MSDFVPRVLRDLPAPWGRLDLDTRSIPNSEEARAAAVEVLDRALSGLAQLPPSSLDELPEDMTIAWGLHNSSLVVDMPRFDDVQIETIRDSFNTLEPSPSASEFRLYGIEFVRQQASRMIRRTKDWLFETLRDAPDMMTIRALYSVVDRWWRKHPEVVSSLLFNLSRLDPDGTLDMARRIVAEPDVDPDLGTALANRIKVLSASRM